MAIDYSKLNGKFSKIGDIAKEVGPFLEKMAEAIKALFKNIVSENNPNLVCLETQFLTKDYLIETAKKYKVSKATAVAALFEKDEKSYYIKLAYLIDRELLPEAENKYINIIAEGVARDVEILFGDNKCIILK